MTTTPPDSRGLFWTPVPGGWVVRSSANTVYVPDPEVWSDALARVVSANTARDLLTGITSILANTERLLTMSQTLSQQLDAATQAIRDDVAAVSAEVTALLAGVTPGSTITQAQVDALTAIDASLKAIPAAPTP